MSTIRDVFVTVTLQTRDFAASLEKLGAMFGALTADLHRMRRRFRRMVRPSNGHRHRGTRDWQLRYAPARKDVQLGYRTIAKAKALR